MDKNFNKNLDNDKNTSNGKNSSNGKNTSNGKNASNGKNSSNGKNVSNDKNASNGKNSNNGMKLPSEALAKMEAIIQEGFACHQNAHEVWRIGEEVKGMNEKKQFYRDTYMMACEIVAPVARQNSRSLGIQSVSDPVSLMSPSAVVMDGGAFFYTMEFPILENNADVYGIAFKQRLNTQLGNYAYYYGMQLPLAYQALAANLRIMMVRNIGNAFVGYFGLMNDPLTQRYMNNRNRRR